MPAWLAQLLRNRTALLVAGAGGVAGLALFMSRRQGTQDEDPTGYTFQDPGALDYEVAELRQRVEDLEAPPVPPDHPPSPPRPPQVPTGPSGPTGPNRNPGPRRPAPPTKPKPRRRPQPAPQRKPRIYTVRSGDSLAEIAQRYRIKSGARGIYAHPGNRSRIEAAARRHGYKNSRNGALIFPGTKLWLGMR